MTGVRGSDYSDTELALEAPIPLLAAGVRKRPWQCTSVKMPLLLVN